MFWLQETHNRPSLPRDRGPGSSSTVKPGQNIALVTLVLGDYGGNQVEVVDFQDFQYAINMFYDFI